MQKPSGFVLFGQGVGADAALQFAHAHPERTQAVILESVYDTRCGWILDRYGPVIGHIAAKFLHVPVSEPGEILETLACPVLLLTPEKDTFVRSAQRKLVLERLPRQATHWTVPNAKYLGIFADRQGVWHERVLKWLESLKSNTQMKRVRKKR